MHMVSHRKITVQNSTMFPPTVTQERLELVAALQEVATLRATLRAIRMQISLPYRWPNRLHTDNVDSFSAIHQSLYGWPDHKPSLYCARRIRRKAPGEGVRYSRRN